LDCSHYNKKSLLLKNVLDPSILNNWQKLNCEIEKAWTIYLKHMQGFLHHPHCSAEGGLTSLAAWPIFQRPKPVLRTILMEVLRAEPGTYCGRLSSRFETDWAWLQREQD